MKMPQKVRHYLGHFLWKEKYDYAFILECVELVIKKHYSDRYVSKFKHIPRWNIRKGVSFYKTCGEIGNPYFFC
jgi:hypothetical protein